MPIPQKSMDTNILSYGFGSQKTDTGLIRIEGIFKGSPADRAGLKLGDEIVKIRNEANSELTYEDLFALIKSKDNLTIKLLVKHNNREKEVVLKKAMLLPEIKQ